MQICQKKSFKRCMHSWISCHFRQFMDGFWAVLLSWETRQLSEAFQGCSVALTYLMENIRSGYELWITFYGHT